MCAKGPSIKYITLWGGLGKRYAVLHGVVVRVLAIVTFVKNKSFNRSICQGYLCS